jgi:hypothetical protein
MKLIVIVNTFEELHSFFPDGSVRGAEDDFKKYKLESGGECVRLNGQRPPTWSALNACVPSNPSYEVVCYREYKRRLR